MKNITIDDVGIIIPCFNEEAHISSLLNIMIKKDHIPPENILVVNDGSTDNTANELSNFDINIINHKKNIGKGESIKTGINFYKIKPNIKGIIILDGDNQHNPDYITKFIEKYNINNPNLIIGARNFKNSTMPFMRKISNTLTSLLISKAIKTKIFDSQSGYRFLDRKAFELFKPSQSGFQAESEMLFIISKANLKISHIKIDTIYNDNNGSKINPIGDTLKFIKWYIKTVFSNK